ncbi:unnamed protein product [Arabidopsis thaliana]|uniref:(thale cress) hypothetical protein n=1 Tax=Arabidopsis thaliana TaxID=3702 RepID=A0A7G2FKE8_ARATH|nr:unnamed protein product [Arabidopsis thaliana]
MRPRTIVAVNHALAARSWFINQEKIMKMVITEGEDGASDGGNENDEDVGMLRDGGYVIVS